MWKCHFLYILVPIYIGGSNNAPSKGQGVLTKDDCAYRPYCEREGRFFNWYAPQHFMPTYTVMVCCLTQKYIHAETHISPCWTNNYIFQTRSILGGSVSCHVKVSWNYEHFITFLMQSTLDWSWYWVNTLSISLVCIRNFY